LFKKVIFKLDKHFEEYLLAVLLVMISVVMMIQVVMRYVFNSALSWPEEFCRYCFIYMTFLTIGYCVQRQSMLRLDIIIKSIPKIIGDIMEFIIWIICLVFFGYMFFNAIALVKLTIASKRTTPTMGIPFYIIYISTILGFGLGVLRNIQLLYKFIRDRIGGGAKKEESIWH